MNKFDCSLCKKSYEVQTSGGTGYATTPDGWKICYVCCAELDKERLRRGEKLILYLTKSVAGWEIINWPGTLRFKPSSVVKQKQHVFNRHMTTRYDAWFCFEQSWFHLKVIGDMDCGTARKLTERKAISKARNRFFINA